MNWFKDKKNAPIVVGLLIVVAAVTIFFTLYQMGVIGSSGAPDESTAASPPAASVPGTPSAVSPTPATNASIPATPALSGTSIAAAPGSQTGQSAKAVTPGPLTTKDPFRLPVTSSEKNRRNQLTAELTRNLVPPLSIASYKSTDRLQASATRTSTTPAANPNQRVSGILYNNGIYAILETSGVSEAVRPGQSVDGGRVISIQSDGLTLLTENNQTVKVPLQPTVPGGGAGGGYPGGGFPGGGGGNPGGGFPGGGFPGGGAPGKGFNGAGTAD